MDTNMDTNKDTKQAATSVATSASTQGAVPFDASSMKGQQALQKTKVLTDGPSYYPEDHQHQQLPGAVPVDASSMKGQQALQKTQALTNGPSYYPEDHQLLPSSLEQDLVSSKRAVAGKPQNEKSDELKKSGNAKKETRQSLSISEKRVKRISARSDRQENRRSRTTGSQASAPGAIRASMNSTGSDQENSFRSAEEDSSSDLQFETENTVESTDMILKAQLVLEEDTELLTQNEREKIRKEARQSVIGEMGHVAQAEVVEDDGSNTRRRALLCSGIMVILLAIIILGSVLGTRDASSSQSAISVPATTAPTISSAPSESPSLRPSASPSLKPSQIPTVSPLDNNLCEEAHPIFLRDAVTFASLENADIQGKMFCEIFNSPFYSLPGLWYKYTGQGKPVIAEAGGAVHLQVYRGCSSTCDVPDAMYGFPSEVEIYGPGVNRIAWTALSGVEYRLLITSNDPCQHGTSAGEEFQLQVVDNDLCQDAFGPINPGVGTFLSGSTSNGATVDAESPSCGSASSATAPGVWYTVVGNGGAITTSTCSTGTDFQSQISVFSTPLSSTSPISTSPISTSPISGSPTSSPSSSPDVCGLLTCVAGNNNACGSGQSSVAFQSIQDQTYHVLVHGFGEASGNFVLQIVEAFRQAGDFCATSQMLELGVPRSVSLADATEDNKDADLPECYNSPISGLTFGIWHSIVGTGNTMSVQLESTLVDDLCGTLISVFTGSGCSNLSCVLKNCNFLCDPSCINCACEWESTALTLHGDWESTAEQVYYIFISYHDLDLDFSILYGAPVGSLILTVS